MNKAGKSLSMPIVIFLLIALLAVALGMLGIYWVWTHF